MHAVDGAAALVEFLSHVWQSTRTIVSAAWPCRFTILVALAGALGMWLPDQGRELVFSIMDRGSWPAIVASFAILVWAYCAWLWSRLALVMCVGKTEIDRIQERYRPLYQHTVTWLPRTLAISVYLVFLSLLIKGLTIDPTLILYILIVINLILSTGLILILVRRNKLSFGHLLGPPQNIGRVTPTSFRALGRAGRNIFYMHLGVAVALLAFGMAMPQVFGSAFGSLAVAFFGMAGLIPVGSWLAIASHRIKFPIIGFMIMCSILVSLWNGNHRVSTVEPNGAMMPEQRPDITAAFDQWRNVGGNEDARPIIVATAGGGLRAAYWTQTVLGTIQDLDAGFADRVIAISGVSGGSLGAAVFVALLHRGDLAKCVSKAEIAQRNSPLTACGHVVLSRDFLAAGLAGLLFRDVPQSFWPFGEGFVPSFAIPDRAAALEAGWEAAWANALGVESEMNVMAAPFLSLWPNDHKWRPALLLNGVSEETGKRIITTNVVLADDGGLVTLDAYDFHGLIDGDVRLSTAAHNSARFTYLSPAGRMVKVDPETGESINNGHILDGGYFENFGAVTARELFQWLANAPGNSNPLVIQISSDQDLPEDAISTNPPPPSTPVGRAGANEIVAPPIGLYQTRSARGIHAAQELARTAGSDSFVHFRICRENATPPLGWVMSRATHADLRRQICTCDDNRNALEDVLKWLARDVATVASFCAPMLTPDNEQD